LVPAGPAPGPAAADVTSHMAASGQPANIGNAGGPGPVGTGPAPGPVSNFNFQGASMPEVNAAVTTQTRALANASASNPGVAAPMAGT